MKYRKPVFAALLSIACTSVLAAPPRIDLSSLNDVASTSRFIVKYRSDSAERIQPAARQRALDAATIRATARMAGPAALRGANGALRVGTLRATQGGRHVITASRSLDRGEAEALMREIAADPNVEYIAVDAMNHPAALPNDPLLASRQMWHYGAGKGGAYVTQAWDAGAAGAGVVVAVLDTGVTPHADLLGNLLPGYDFITNAFVSRRTTNDRAPGGWDLGDWAEAEECGPLPSNSSWHGTHVAGTVAAVTNNGMDGAGVAPQAKILPVRVLGRCGGYVSDISDAIVWAAGGHVDGVADNANPAEVVNLSLGGGGLCPAIYQDAINQAVSLGATVVVAAGNANIDVANFNPANCANVVTVAATGYSGTRASYSNYGTGIDLSAPGGGGVEGTPNGFIWSTLNSGARQPVASPAGDIFRGYTGTSMATPHVAGTVALMQSVAPTPLTPAQAKAVLVASARLFPTQPPAARSIGSGILNAAAAVDLARKFGQPISASPLTSGIAERVAPIAAGQSVLYSIDVPAGKRRLDLLTYGGQGTATLLAQLEAEPTSSSYRGSSTRPGTNQAITIYAPASGRYYVKVTATADSAGIYIRALVQ